MSFARMFGLLVAGLLAAAPYPVQPVCALAAGPWLDILTPDDNCTVNRSVLLVQGAVESGANLTVNGLDVPASPEGRWSVAITLVEGRNLIVVVASDRYENRTQVTLTVFLDTTPPMLSVFSPADGCWTNRTNLTVEGMTEEGANVTVNGAGVRLEGRLFRAQVVLEDGQNLITVSASDKACNTRKLTLHVTVDTRPPLLEITNPYDGYVTNASTVSVNGQTEPASSVSVNGRPAFLEGTLFEAPVPLSEGDNLICVTARDIAGNCNAVICHVIRDSTPPSISLVWPFEGALLNENATEVRGRTEPGATVRVNGVLAEMAGGDFTANVPLATEGQNDLTVEAWDAVWNRATQNRSVVRDTRKPELGILSPQNGTFTHRTAVNLSGWSEPGANLTVNGRPAPVEASGLFSIEVPLVEEGANLFDVVARDPAGNTVETTVVVIRDTVLVYNITSPMDGQRLKRRTVEVSGSVEPGAYVIIQASPVPVGHDGNFSQMVNLVDGPNTIRIEFTDRAGNYRSLSLTVIKEPPETPPSDFIGGFSTVAMVAAAAIALVAVGVLRRRKDC